ncbi:hypothetical protein C0J52_03415 [Blattella germanica]|nr:hypothetical protein C0J52_03415 [Blattella germanica]
MSDKERQKDEICALDSIYNEEEFQVHDENGLSKGTFYAYIDLPSEFKVVYKNLRQEDSSLQEFPVKYLPPLCLHFSLPEDYPSHSPPTYRLSCQWLRNSKLLSLCKKLDEIWKENKYMEVLFLWTQFLKEESLTYLEIFDTLDISLLETTFMKHEEFKQARRARQLEAETKQRAEKSEGPLKDEPNVRANRGFIAEYQHRKPRGGRQHWQGYSKTQDEGSALEKMETQEGRSTSKVMYCNNKSRSFYNKRDRCGRGINAYGSKVGSNCLPNNSNEQIVLDSKDAVNSSSKCDNLVIDQEPSYSKKVKEIGDHGLSAESKDCEVVFSDQEGEAACGDRKYRLPNRPRMSVVKLLREYNEARQKTEFNRSFFTCKICFQVQELVSPEMFSRYDSVLLSALLATMQDMLYCPRPACQYPVALEPDEKRLLVEEYNNASEEVQIEMEQRYGKKQLLALVDTYLSENWVDSNSKRCPTCNSAIEKADGCNKMVCWKCNTIFCWLCEERLNPTNPYVHFNNPTSKCYNLLFHGVPLSDDEDGWFHGNYAIGPAPVFEDN